MLNRINETRVANIITVQDPIEMLFSDKKSFINQREIGTDSRNHISAIRQSLRHDPDVLYVDQVNDEDSMQAVLAASSACLVITTLPSLGARDAIEAVVDFFPARAEAQVRNSFAAVLQGIISQRLLAREDGKGRVAAFEVLVMTPRVHDIIVKSPGAEDLETLMRSGEYYGMQTMDQQLLELHVKHLISVREALSASAHPQELRVHLQRSSVE